MEAVRQVALSAPDHRKQEITRYVEWQVNKGADTDYKVVHLESVKTEVVFGEEHVVWDVHTDEPGRWWVITAPTNLYSQKLFPSLDYTLSFHIGVTARIQARESKRAPAASRDRFRAPWRRWETASEAIDFAQEAEDFQAVGMRCRETLLSLVKQLQKDMPVEKERPQAANFEAWFMLIADHFAPGSRNERIRGYLKATSREVWQLVNWLTHTSKANLVEAHLALDATENLLGMTSLVVMRSESQPPDTCPSCNSYRVVSVFDAESESNHPYFNLCESCGWTDRSDANV